MQETVDPWVLTQTLTIHAASPRQRLVSLLISRAQLDSDDGAMALSEQLGYPAALQRHLERRDPDCANLIPRELIQRWVVLPLGRSRDGALVVVARDPTPILAAALEHAARVKITLAVTPGIHLEKLIRSIYGLATDPDTTAPEPSLTEELAGSIDIEPTPTPLPARTVSGMLYNDGTPELPKRRPQGTDRIDTALLEIENTITLAAAERLAFSYASRRWQASLLLDVQEGLAIGRRGQGPRLTSVDTIMLSLTTPSTLQVAYETATATGVAPGSAIQQRLCQLLGDATIPAAAPIVVGGEVRGLLVVGDPRRGDARESVADLARLADSIGAAHERFPRGR